MAKPATILLTCEHASHRVPAAYRSLFADAEAVLLSHRGWDPGALRLSQQMAGILQAPLLKTNFSRLLIEPNRSPHHPRLFSEFTRSCRPATKLAIKETFYERYRHGVERWLEERMGQGGPVLHLSIHTFTPKLNGQIRNAEIGLLYDPQRTGEQQFCRNWRQAMLETDKQKASRTASPRNRVEHSPRLRVRLNYPYRGNADGFTTFLRRRFSPSNYWGIELEVTQGYQSDVEVWRKLGKLIAESLASVVDQL